MTKKVRTTSLGNPSEEGQINGRNLISEGNLDQVRDILFGAQLKEYDKRLEDLESLIKRELTHFQNEFQSRLDIVEDHFKNEIAALNSKLKKEQSEREADNDRATERQEEHKRTMQRKLADLDEQVDSLGRDLRELILKQCKNLSETAERSYESLKNELVVKAGMLHAAKTDRTALATMFSEMAIRLGAEDEEPADP